MRRLPALAAACFVAPLAGAYPDGAPWGSANPADDQHCGSCHFETDPVRDSAALRIEGLPDERPAPAGTYELAIVFEDADAAISGFQLIAVAPDSNAGAFESSDEDVEFVGAAIRSVRPASMHGVVRWLVHWRAPPTIALPIVFHVAASAANHDESPLGDVIHFRRYQLGGAE